MIKSIIETITKPIATLEKKYDNNIKKILIILGIIVGVFFVANLLSTMYETLLLSKGWTGKIDWSSLGHINYLKFILEFILEQLIYIGSIFAGIFVISSITKKDFKLVDVLSLIVVMYTAKYLVSSVLNILFMFKFMQIKFLLALETAILATARYYTGTLFVIGLQKLYDVKFDDKGIIRIAITFGVIFVIRHILLILI